MRNAVGDARSLESLEFRRRDGAVGSKSALKRLIVAASILYVASALGVWLSLAWLADRWWPATLLLFAPRWMIALPLAVLIPAAAMARTPRLLAALMGAGLVVLGPVMGFCAPSPLAAAGEGQTLRVYTQNLGRLKIDSAPLLARIAELSPDVVTLQECGANPAGTSPLPGYSLHVDTNTCFLSRLPIRAVDARDRTDVWNKGGAGAITLYEIETPAGPVAILNLHLETVREGLEALRDEKLGGVADMEANIAQRRWESELAREWATRTKAPLVVAGDFNMPIESAIYRDFWSTFGNAFSDRGLGYGTTKQTRLIGVRIDHVLYGEGIRCADARVVESVGSDHLGVVADLVIAR